MRARYVDGVGWSAYADQIDWSTVPIQSPATPPACNGAMHHFPKGIGNVNCYCGAFHHDGLHEPEQYVRNERRDPYQPSCRDKFPMEALDWLLREQETHRSKQAQALAQLNKPIRTGPLKNRDRYGQLLSARGWETEETDP